MNWRCGLFRLWIVGAALFPATVAFAQSKDVAYYCVGEAAGGLFYNEKTKKWEAITGFVPFQRFVLKMKFLGARVRKERAIEEQVSDYKVTVTESDQNIALSCRDDDPNKSSDDPNKTVTVSDQFRTFSCATTSYDYQFNLGTRRFLSIYRYGYTNGNDNNDDNPSVEAGTCTKID